MVDFYSKSDYKNKYNSEAKFYSNSRTYETKQIDDVIFVKTYISDYYANEAEYYFVDSNGNIIKKINGTNPDITLSVNDDNLQVIINRIENNEIYFEVYKNRKIMEATGSSICSLRYDSVKMKDAYYYIDKITYLGNNEFKLDQKVETKMYDDYMLEWMPFIDCSPATMKGNQYGYRVQNIDNYYVGIENDVLKLVDGNGKLITELATLENNLDYNVAMRPGPRYMKVEDNTKICSVSKDGIYVFMGNSYDMDTDYSHMHVIYYDINTGEKSELIQADAEGHFGDLATCR